MRGSAIILGIAGLAQIWDAVVPLLTGEWRLLHCLLGRQALLADRA